MVDDYLILTTERLRDDLGNLKANLRTTYPNKQRQVTSPKLREEAARLAETWMVEIAQRDEVLQNIPSNFRADLNVHFQRILTFSEHSSKRSRYESELNSILKDFTAKFIIPLKQLRHAQPGAKPATATQASRAVADLTSQTRFSPTAFIGQSFSADDRIVNDCVRNTLESLGIEAITGERPRADRISSKVKKRIERQHLFIGIFTRRDKLATKDEWTTSAWVIDEKAYAAGKEKKLILFKEEGVGSIGGIQGDYEYVEFSRQQLEKIPLSLMEILEVEVKGLRMH